MIEKKFPMSFGVNDNFMTPIYQIDPKTILAEKKPNELINLIDGESQRNYSEAIKLTLSNTLIGVTNIYCSRASQETVNSLDEIEVNYIPEIRSFFGYVKKGEGIRVKFKKF